MNPFDIRDFQNTNIDLPPPSSENPGKISKCFTEGRLILTPQSQLSVLSDLVYHRPKEYLLKSKKNVTDFPNKNIF